MFGLLKLYVQQFLADDINTDTLSVNDSIDVSGANTTGFPTDGIRGSYDTPAHTGTVTLSTGQEPAATVTLPFMASALVSRGTTQESGLTLQDDLWAVPGAIDFTNGETTWRIEWRGADPGADETLDYEVLKAF